MNARLNHNRKSTRTLKRQLLQLSTNQISPEIIVCSCQLRNGIMAYIVCYPTHSLALHWRNMSRSILNITCVRWYVTVQVTLEGLRRRYVKWWIIMIQTTLEGHRCTSSSWQHQRWIAMIQTTLEGHCCTLSLWQHLGKEGRLFLNHYSPSNNDQVSTCVTCR